MKTNNLYMRSQRGITLISVIIIGALLACVLVIGFRCVPAVTEYMAVKRAMYAASTNADLSTPKYEIERDFDRRSEIDDITSVKGSDLNIYNDSGKVVISVEYSRKVPLFGNVSLLFDFNTTTRDAK